MKRTRFDNRCTCGRFVVRHGILCSVCSLKNNLKFPQVEDNTFNLIWEISPNNVDLRLKEGFALLQEN